MARIQLPHQYKPRDYQLPFLRAWEKYKRIVWVAHRRSGKDKTVFAHLPVRMFERVGLYLYFLPRYTQAKKVIWNGADKDGFRFLSHFPEEIIKNKNETEMRIELINGSIIQMVGADNIDSIVGTNPVGVVFSEYSLMKSKVWDFIRPILAENGGWAVFIFTPRGTNHAFKLLEHARKDVENWWSQVLTVEDTQAISEHILDQEQEEMPSDLFSQEYFCNFLEGASSFFKGVDRNVYKGNEPIYPSHYYKQGVDLAKFQDFTVITPFDLCTFKVYKQDRFNQIDYVLQKAKIEASYLRYHKAKTTIDSTGVGEPVYDDLYDHKIDIEPFHFTEHSRRDLLINLQVLIEQDKIKLPDDEGLINELKAFHWTLTDTGKLRIESDITDDRVMSLALAVWDIPSSPRKPRVNEDKLIVSQFDSHTKAKKKYFTGSPYLRR